MGGGRMYEPRFMFVFINPTKSNISSDLAWAGPRFPFVGTKPVWRIFHRAGLLTGKLAHAIQRRVLWDLKFTQDVLEELDTRSCYFTNIVKVAGADAALPTSAMIRLFLPLLAREIEIIKPKYVVTFCLIPFEAITKQKNTITG